MQTMNEKKIKIVFRVLRNNVFHFSIKHLSPHLLRTSLNVVRGEVLSEAKIIQNILLLLIEVLFLICLIVYHQDFNRFKK